MYDVSVSFYTDIGDVRKTNQDSIFSNVATINNRKVGLFIVADGCGGLAFGKEISNLIITYFSRFFYDELEKAVNEEYNDEQINDLLEKAIRSINAMAIDFSRQAGSKVGSTLSLLLTVEDRYFVKNIGDSRIYLRRKQRISQITKDQTLVAELIRNGELTVAEAKKFKKKNVLTMCIGIFDDIKIYSVSGKIRNGDLFLICSDGLYNSMSEKEMNIVLGNKKISFENIALELRRYIKSGEAKDNVSAVIAGYSKKEVPKKIIAAFVFIMIVCVVPIYSDTVKLLCGKLVRLVGELLKGIR